MIKLLAIGHLGKDCTVNIVNQKNVINFNLAHSEKWKDAQGTQMEKTTWLSCSYWVEKTAIAQYLKKGVQLFVEGTVEATVYTNNRGEAIPQLNVRVFSVQMLGGNKENTSQGIANPSPTGNNVHSDIPQGNQDIPF